MSTNHQHCTGKTVTFAKGNPDLEGTWEVDGAKSHQDVTPYGGAFGIHTSAHVTTVLTLTKEGKTIITVTSMDLYGVPHPTKPEILSGSGTIDGGDPVPLVSGQKGVITTTGKKFEPASTKGTIRSTDATLTTTVDLTFN